MNAIKAMTLQFITVVLAIIGAGAPGHEITPAQDQQTSFSMPLREKITDEEHAYQTKSYLEEVKERSYSDKLLTIYP